MTSQQNVDIPSLIQATQSANNAQRQNAEATLKKLRQHHLPNYLLELCRILQDGTVPPPVRQGAGLLLKNAVTSSRGDRNEIRQRWLDDLDDGTRSKIKRALLDTLSCRIEEARSTAVIVVSNLAVIESLSSWKSLVPDLLRKAASSEHAMAAALRTVGQIAESEWMHDDLQPFSPKILECIAKGMSCTTAPALQSESMKTLGRFVELIEPNMAHPQQQAVIMQMVCCGAKPSTNTSLRIAALMAMAKIVECYYQMMKPWMQQLFQITKQAISRGVEHQHRLLHPQGGNANVPSSEQVDADQLYEITRQAIEVWSTTADIELEIVRARQEAKAKGVSAQDIPTNHGFVEKSVQLLVPVYLQALLLQSDEFEPDAWTVRKAAACSLEMFAMVVGDHILKYVLKFVESNIGSSNWRSREAALCAFGMVLDGPSAQKLTGLVGQIMGVVVKLMADGHAQVRLSAVWVLGRVCSVVPSAGQAFGPKMLMPLVTALHRDVAMAEKACWCLTSMCALFGDDPWIYHGNNAKQMIAELLSRATKGDVTGPLLLGVHEALNTLISYAPPKDTALRQLVGSQLLPELGQQLFGVVEGLRSEGGGAGSDVTQHRMAGLLSTIQVVLEVVARGGGGADGALSPQLSDQLMECCCTVLDAEHALVYEEALGAVTAIARCIGGHFRKYLMAQRVQDLLIRAVRNGKSNEDICRIGVGCIGDVYGACHEAICGDPVPLQKYTDHLVSELLTLLIDTAVGLALKVHIIASLTDIMLAHGPRASRYSGDILEKCLEIGVLRPPQDADEELWADFNEIRAEICDVVRSCMLELTEKASAATSADDRAQRVVANHIVQINKFVEAMALDLHRADSNALQKCIMLLNDAALFADSDRSLKDRLKTQSAQRILEAAGQQKEDHELRNAARAAFEALNK